jgi:hypothetical protein
MPRMTMNGQELYERRYNIGDDSPPFVVASVFDASQLANVKEKPLPVFFTLLAGLDETHTSPSVSISPTSSRNPL